MPGFYPSRDSRHGDALYLHTPAATFKVGGEIALATHDQDAHVYEEWGSCVSDRRAVRSGKPEYLAIRVQSQKR